MNRRNVFVMVPKFNSKNIVIKDFPNFIKNNNN